MTHFLGTVLAGVLTIAGSLIALFFWQELEARKIFKEGLSALLIFAGFAIFFCYGLGRVSLAMIGAIFGD